MKYFCTPYSDDSARTIYGIEKLTVIEYVDQMQDKAHAQAQGKHAQTSAGHARTKGPCKHTTRTRRHGLSVKTNMLTNAQTRSSYAQAWCKARAHKRDPRCSHPGNSTRRVAVAVPCYDCCSSSIILSKTGFLWVLLGASGLVREVVHVQGAAVAWCHAPFPM